VINNHIISAQDILSELTASLDFEKGGVLAKNLLSLYSFMNRQLMEANLKKDPAPLQMVKKHLSELREAWEVISSRKGLEEKGGAVTGVNIAG
jgi:flagellar protein FliS